MIKKQDIEAKKQDIEAEKQDIDLSTHQKIQLEKLIEAFGKGTVFAQ